MISKELKFLLTHSSIYGLGTVASQIVSFILLPFYTRYLTPKDYGVLELIEITAGAVGFVVSLGIVRAMSRFYYEKNDSKYRNSVVSTTYIIYALMVVFSSLFLFPLSGFFSEICLKSRQYSNLITISFLSMFLGGLVDIGLMYLRLIKKSYIFVSITVSRLSLLIILNILFVVHFNMGVLGILYSSLITRTLFSLIITIAIVRRTGPFFSLRLAKKILRFSLPFIPSNVINLLINKSDRYFILYYVAIGDTGIYALAQKLGTATHALITQPFLMAFAPRRFEIIKKNPEDTPYILSKIFSYYTLFMIFVGLSISILIPEILQLMTTPKFYRAGPLVPIIVLSMVIFGFRYHFEFGILWAKKTEYYMYINGFVSFVNLGLNFLLIPNFGIWGAVSVSLITITIHSIILYFISNRLYPIPFEFFRLFKMFVIACVYYIASMIIHTGNIWTDLALNVSLIITFPVTLVVLNLITKEEKSRARTLFYSTNHKINSWIKLKSMSKS